ncbi:MAG: hypothetical protein ACP5JT_01320 [Thermoplasmata archaeon]
MISEILAGVQFILSLFFTIISLRSFIIRKDMKYGFFLVSMLSFMIESILILYNYTFQYLTPIWCLISFNLVIMVFLFLSLVR